MTINLLRRYVALGFLSPTTVDGIQYYSEHDQLRIMVVQKALGLGFNLSEIQTILSIKKSAPTLVVTSIKQSRMSQLIIADTQIALSRSLIERSRKDLDATWNDIASVRSSLL